MRSLTLALLGLFFLTGACASVPVQPPTVDVTGRWEGTWSGAAMGITRAGTAEADFSQTGATGRGRITLSDTAAGSGLPVKLQVSGNHLLVEHESGGQFFTAEFTVTGDQMEGRFPHSAVPVRVTLRRAR